jgi:PAS domain S-box-containing protein
VDGEDNSPPDAKNGPDASGSVIRVGVRSTNREGEEPFWFVFERSSNPIVLLDRQRHIVQTNTAAAELLGYPRAALAGMPIDDLVRGPEPSEVREEWDQLLRSGALAGRRVLARADGSELEVDFAASVATIEEREVAVSVILPLRAGAFARPLGEEAPEELLTDREREIVALIALGFETNHIAAQLHISADTVRTHVKNAMAKLQVHTRAQLVASTLCSKNLARAAQLARRSGDQ